MINTAPLDFIGIDQKIPWERKKGIIKQEPEDFIVQEITPDGSILNDKSVLQSKEGLFTHIVLKKRNLDTFSAIRELSDFLGLKVGGNDIIFAGLKDFKAITYQRGSLWNVRPEELDSFIHDRIQIISAVSGLYEVEPGDLIGNHFVIKVISPSSNIDSIQNSMKVLTDSGFPNFFMLQRFGSKRPILHVFGKEILMGNYKSAVMCYLSAVSSLENTQITQAREILLERDLDGLKEFRRMMPINYNYEHQLAKKLERKHPNYQKSLFSLPRRFLELAISAYQSYLYNRILSRLLKGDNRLTLDTQIPLPGIELLKQMNHDTDFSDDVTAVMAEEKLDNNVITKNRAVKSFKTRIRRAIVTPENAQLKKSSNGFQIEFSLQKGCYATALINQLILSENDQVTLKFPESVNWGN